MLSCSILGCAGVVTKWALVVDGSQVIEYAHCKDHGDRLATHYRFPNPLNVILAPGKPNYEECQLHGLFSNSDPESYNIILINPKTFASFLAPTGYVELTMIGQMIKKKRGEPFSTHELMEATIQVLGGLPAEGLVCGFDNANRRWECKLLLKQNNDEMSVNCRISDLVALSVHSSLRIRVRREYLGKMESFPAFDGIPIFRGNR